MTAGEGLAAVSWGLATAGVGDLAGTVEQFFTSRRTCRCGAALNCPDGDEERTDGGGGSNLLRMLETLVAGVPSAAELVADCRGAGADE